MAEEDTPTGLRVTLIWKMTLSPRRLESSLPGAKTKGSELKSSCISGTSRHMVDRTPLVKVLILMTSQLLLGSQSDQQNFHKTLA